MEWTEGGEEWKGPFGWKDELRQVLLETFKLASFRTLQEEIINAALDRRDAFVLLPTGGGKSLCYQLPAVMASGVTVVISPLLSLMLDQVEHLDRIGVPAAMIGGSTSKQVRPTPAETWTERHMLMRCGVRVRRCGKAWTG